MLGTWLCVSEGRVVQGLHLPVEHPPPPLFTNTVGK